MVDKVKIEQAVRLLLEGIGEDITREGLIDTPDRIARMCEEIYGGLGQFSLCQPLKNNLLCIFEMEIILLTKLKRISPIVIECMSKTFPNTI